MASFAVFASGRGSNFRKIEESLSDSRHHLVCMVTDRADSRAAEYAVEKKIEVLALNYREKTKREVEEALVAALDAREVELCVLAGFMRLLSPAMVDAFPRRIVNIHPSLLPDYPGTDAIEKSFRSGDTVAGITIHYVDYGMDTGPIIIQERFSRDVDETLETFEARIHALEHKVYPRVVRRLLGECDSSASVRTLR